MSETNPVRPGRRAAVAALAAAPFAWAARLRAADKPALAKHLVGGWVIAGTPDKPEDPAKGGRLKFFSGRHWAITQHDPDTGKVVFHHGGTYKLDGDKYAETVEYATEATAELVGKTFKFKVTADGDVFTQVGDGNPYTERWVRAN